LEAALAIDVHDCLMAAIDIRTPRDQGPHSIGAHVPEGHWGVAENLFYYFSTGFSEIGSHWRTRNEPETAKSLNKTIQRHTEQNVVRLPFANFNTSALNRSPSQQDQ
jgi:hypothetical protein